MERTVAHLTMIVKRYRVSRHETDGADFRTQVPAVRTPLAPAYSDAACAVSEVQESVLERAEENQMSCTLQTHTFAAAHEPRCECGVALRFTLQPQLAPDPQLQARLTTARLTVNDFHPCATNEELAGWRAAQQNLIDIAMMCGRVEAHRSKCRCGHSMEDHLCTVGACQCGIEAKDGM